MAEFNQEIRKMDFVLFIKFSFFPSYPFTISSFSSFFIYVSRSYVLISHSIPVFFVIIVFVGVVAVVVVIIILHILILPLKVICGFPL